MRVTILRSLFLLAFGSLCVAGACGVDDLLVGAACNDDADCPGLTCVRTAAQSSNNTPGVCSEDGGCVPGEQVGCAAASDGSCELGLFVTAAQDGTEYCCESGTNPTVIRVSEDDGTAECFDCPSCNTGNEEPCLAGDDRCTVEEDEPCGCRTTDEAVLDTPCDDDEDCGTAQCVRTLEQEEELQEPQVADQAIEQGLCRPDASCAGGLQAGCLMPSGAGCTGASTVQVDVGSLTYCCPEPANNSEFYAQVYVVSADQRQVACTACERRACLDDAGNFTIDECTAVSDATCVVPAGSLCGCPPVSG